MKFEWKEIHRERWHRPKECLRLFGGTMHIWVEKVARAHGSNRVWCASISLPIEEGLGCFVIAKEETKEQAKEAAETWVKTQCHEILESWRL